VPTGGTPRLLPQRPRGCKSKIARPRPQIINCF